MPLPLIQAIFRSAKRMIVETQALSEFAGSLTLLDPAAADT